MIKIPYHAALQKLSQGHFLRNQLTFSTHHVHCNGAELHTNAMRHVDPVLQAYSAVRYFTACRDCRWRYLGGSCYILVSFTEPISLDLVAPCSLGHSNVRPIAKHSGNSGRNRRSMFTITSLMALKFWQQGHFKIFQLTWWWILHPHVFDFLQNLFMGLSPDQNTPFTFIRR